LVSKSDAAHAAESDRLQLVLQRAIRASGGAMSLTQLQIHFDHVAHTAGFPEVQHGLTQFLRLYSNWFVLSHGLSAGQTRVSLTPEAVIELEGRDEQDASYEYELRPPPEVAMDATLPAYAEWYHIHGPGSEGKPRQPRAPPTASASVQSTVHVAAAGNSAAAASFSSPLRAGRVAMDYPPGSLSSATVAHIEEACVSVLQNSPANMHMSSLASAITTAMRPTKFIDQFGMPFKTFLNQRAHMFSITTPAGQSESVVTLLGAPEAAAAAASPATPAQKMQAPPGGMASPAGTTSRVVRQSRNAADATVVCLLLQLLHTTGHPMPVYALGHQFNQATGMSYMEYAAAHGSNPGFIPLLQAHPNHFSLIGPLGAKTMVKALQAPAMAAAGAGAATGASATAGAQKYSAASTDAETSSLADKLSQTHLAATQTPSKAEHSVTPNASASAAAAAAPGAAPTSSSVVPRTLSVFVMVDGAPKGIRLRVESVAVLQSELALALEDRDLPPLPNNTAFTAIASSAEAEGQRTKLTDEQLWTMEDGARIYVLPPPPPKSVRVLMPPNYDAAHPIHCAADELAELPAALGQQLESAGSRLYDEHVHFSVTKPTAAAPSPPALTADEFRELPSASVVHAVFDWCAAPLSVQTLLRGGVEMDLQSPCVLPTCGGRLLGHHAHLKPAN
jgi:hypothetical protein